MVSLRLGLFSQAFDLGYKNRPCRPGDLWARASRHGVEEQLAGEPQKQAPAPRTRHARLDAVHGLRSATPMATPLRRLPVIVQNYSGFRSGTS